MSDKRVDILTTETLEGDTLTLHGITQAQTDQIIKNQNDITQLNTDLTNEIERAESKESELNSLISSEVTRAETKESELNSLISSETSRAESKESELNSLISSETTRAETKESELNSLITSETSRAESKESELTSLISSETSRAETKESEISARLNKYQIIINATEQYLYNGTTTGLYEFETNVTLSIQIDINFFGASIIFYLSNIDSVEVRQALYQIKEIDLFTLIPDLLNSNYIEQLKNSYKDIVYNSGVTAHIHDTQNLAVDNEVSLTYPTFQIYEIDDEEHNEFTLSLSTYLRYNTSKKSYNTGELAVTMQMFLPFKNLNL